MYWTVSLEDEITYCGIEADTEEEAVQIALNFWIERNPNIVARKGGRKE